MMLRDDHVLLSLSFHARHELDAEVPFARQLGQPDLKVDSLPPVNCPHRSVAQCTPIGERQILDAIGCWHKHLDSPWIFDFEVDLRLCGEQVLKSTSYNDSRAHRCCWGRD